MTHTQAFCQRTGRSISGTCVYALDREVMAAWRRWMKAGPETEGAARLAEEWTNTSVLAKIAVEMTEE